MIIISKVVAGGGAGPNLLVLSGEGGYMMSRNIVGARIQRGMIGTPPAFEGKAILRGAMLYFVPGEMQRKADTIWHRMAQAVLPRAAPADIVPPPAPGAGL